MTKIRNATTTLTAANVTNGGADHSVPVGTDTGSTSIQIPLSELKDWLKIVLNKIAQLDSSVEVIDTGGASYVKVVIDNTDEYRFNINAFNPTTNDGAAIGAPTKRWSDAYFAAGSIISFGVTPVVADDPVLLTHSASKLTLSHGDLDIGANDLITTGYTGRDADNLLSWDVDDILKIIIGGVTHSIASITDGVADNDKLVTQGYVDGIVVDAPTGLEFITEGGHDGWRLIGAVAANYGDIGNGAINLSYSSSTSSVRGATGLRSYAEGFNTIASGYYAHVEGSGAVASGENSHAEGNGTIASSTTAHAEGYRVTASGLSTHAGGHGWDDINRPEASGEVSFNHQQVENGQGIKESLGANSAILGGLNNETLVGATCSVVLGGSSQSASVANTVYMMNANVSTGLILNSSTEMTSVSTGTSNNDKMVTQGYVDDNDDAGANVALSNLSGVAINESLVSDTDNTDALGTVEKAWSDLVLGNESVVTWTSEPNEADVTLTHSADLLTLEGGQLDVIHSTTEANMSAVNVCYGTGSPPATANEGTLFIQYT